jgi:hypothetical protein
MWWYLHHIASLYLLSRGHMAHATAAYISLKGLSITPRLAHVYLQLSGCYSGYGFCNGLQEEEEAEEEEEASKDAQSLRDSIASIKWLREREGGGWPGRSSADPIRQQKLQQMARIKKWVMGCL